MSDTIVAQTALGSIRGLQGENLWGTKYLSFRKIPYAKPPIGNLRFKDPEPIDPWNDILDCTVESPGCSQKMMFADFFLGEEDCLHLSVFTKNKDPKTLLPVMVFIHGGVFVCGSNDTQVYGPDYLIEKDIVLVTINYRLGALGFLSLQDPTLKTPGNAGLKDQSLALRWVKENIAYFGGNPKNVTVFGESAGGASVHYQMISDLSRGLFQKAIIQSGSALCHWALPPDRDWPTRLATALGWDGTGGESAILQTLLNTDHMEIVRAQDKLVTPEISQLGSLSHFGPTIEPYQSEQCMIPCHPRKMCKTAWSNSIPILVGATSEEGLIAFAEAQKYAESTKVLRFFDCVPLDLNLSIYSGEARRIGEEIRSFYLKDNQSYDEKFKSFIDVYTDKVFLHGISRLVRSRCENSKNVPTFLFRFNQDIPSIAFVKSIISPDPLPGVCHGDELGFLFKNSLTENSVKKGSEEYKAIDRLVTIWTTFATTGNPNCDATRPVLWHPVAVTGPPFRCLNIADRLEFCQLPETERLSLWDSFYDRKTLT
ncbi:hypothetical protein DMENIID0001_089980 [Sergentomyia squamirostris]